MILDKKICIAYLLVIVTYINYNDGSTNKIREVNLHADLIRDEDNEDVSVELKIMPPRL